MDRRLSPKTVLVMVIGAVVVGIVVSLVIASHRDPKHPGPLAQPTPTPTPTPCTPLREPYGSPPAKFEYKQAPESQRAATVKALNLNETGGKIDMRLAEQGGITLGSIVGIPTDDPDSYVNQLASTVKAGGGAVTAGSGYFLIPLANGQCIAAGAKGCRAVLIASQDPNGLKFLAASIFGA